MREKAKTRSTADDHCSL